MNPSDWGLRPLVLDDVDAVHAVYSDPETWRHFPEGVFVERERSVALAERAERDWRESGLGEWAVTVRGDVVGTGGVSPRGGWWNLGFRLAPSVWGHGLGTWVTSSRGPTARPGSSTPTVRSTAGCSPRSSRWVDGRPADAGCRVACWPR